MKLTIHQSDEKLVVALPEHVVALLGWESGDLLEAEVVGDELKLVRVDRTMRTADEVMDEYSQTLEELAKS